MRLAWFLPVLRRKAPAGGWLVVAARRLVPRAWRSDPETGRSGLVRRVLRACGPSWLSSPLRRVVQVFCLTLYLALFIYVCWPYTAQPALLWPNWLPVSVDAGNGTVVVASEQAIPAALNAGRQVHVSDAASEPDTYLGAFEIQHVAAREMRLAPSTALSRQQADALAASVGPWTLAEQSPDAWPAHYAVDLQRKERIAAELFLIIDPLVSLSTAIAARSWVWSLSAAAIILGLACVIPRGFCGYLCPLGTTIDLWDWLISRRVERFRVLRRGWWVHLKYYVLCAVLTAALLGILISGFVAAIPVITRAAAFVITPLAVGLVRDWHQVPPIGAGQIVSLVLFCAVLGLGFLQPRFWCKYVCPSGALFSLGNLWRVTERKVEATCIHCNRCVEICPFDAIQADFTTRTLDCTFCQTCGGVCPVSSIKFVERWNRIDLKAQDDSVVGGAPLGRRRFLAGAAGALVGGGSGAAFALAVWPSQQRAVAELPIVRPPGSVPEWEFLGLCIRCGECYQACPNSVLQPLGFQRGLAPLWTPYVAADWSGCEPSCSNCGQVCPTGAIRALSLEEKRVARMGLAVVSEQHCLPFAQREACQLCVDECQRAGYEAIEFQRVGTELNPFGEPIEDSGFLAPVVVADKCVGCGLCQTRCYKINVHEKQLLTVSAIQVQAGSGKEDRLRSGSYRALRERERRPAQPGDLPAGGGSYLPGFLSAPTDP